MYDELDDIFNSVKRYVETDFLKSEEYLRCIALGLKVLRMELEITDEVKGYFGILSLCADILMGQGVAIWKYEMKATTKILNKDFCRFTSMHSTYNLWIDVVERDEFCKLTLEALSNCFYLMVSLNVKIDASDLEPTKRSVYALDTRDIGYTYIDPHALYSHMVNNIEKGFDSHIFDDFKVKIYLQERAPAVTCDLTLLMFGVFSRYFSSADCILYIYTLASSNRLMPRLYAGLKLNNLKGDNITLAFKSFHSERANIGKLCELCKDVIV